MQLVRFRGVTATQQRACALVRYTGDFHSWWLAHEDVRAVALDSIPKLDMTCWPEGQAGTRDFLMQMCVDLYSEWNVLVYVRVKQHVDVDSAVQKSFASKCLLQQFVSCAACKTYLASQNTRKTTARCCYVDTSMDGDHASIANESGQCCVYAQACACMHVCA